MKKKLIAILLILSIIIPLIPTNIISSAASDTDKYKNWETIKFSTSYPSSTGNSSCNKSNGRLALLRWILEVQFIRLKKYSENEDR